MSAWGAGSRIFQETWIHESSIPSSATDAVGYSFNPVLCNFEENFALLEPTEPLVNSPGLRYPLPSASVLSSHRTADTQLLSSSRILQCQERPRARRSRAAGRCL